jgi:hypothetical protein
MTEAAAENLFEDDNVLGTHLLHIEQDVLPVGDFGPDLSTEIPHCESGCL